VAFNVGKRTLKRQNITTFRRIIRTLWTTSTILWTSDY